MARNRSEVLFDQVARFAFIEVAGDRQHGIVGRVINPKELTNVFDSRGVEIFHRSDGRMRVRGIFKAHFKQPQKAIDVRLIVITQTLLFFHRFALIVEVLLRDGERAHAIAFQPKRQRQLVCGQGFEIISPLA